MWKLLPFRQQQTPFNKQFISWRKKIKENYCSIYFKTESIVTALVFTRTKHGADRVAKDLVNSGIRAEAIHGNKSQGARQRALSNFKSQHTRVLVATDIAARGIDVEELSHVINYELPNVPETYVHRIGRTGRAGAQGISLSFCDEEEKEYLHDIHKLIRKTIPVVEDQPYHMTHVGVARPQAQTQQRTSFNQRNNKRSFGNSNKQWEPKPAGIKIGSTHGLDKKKALVSLFLFCG